MSEGNAWLNFASSSHQKNNNHKSASSNSGADAQASFPLRDALRATNTSADVSQTTAATKPVVLSSFFIAHKSDAMMMSPPKQITNLNLSSITGYSPPKKSPAPAAAPVFSPPKQQQQSSSSSPAATTSVAQIRDIALKHLFQPEVVAASADAAAAAQRAMTATTSNSGFGFRDNKFDPTFSETATVSSLGVTPLKFGPVRLGLRRRLGMTMLASSNSKQRMNKEQVDDEEQNEDQQDQQFMHEQHRFETDVLRSIGARALLMKDVPLPTQAAKPKQPKPQQHREAVQSALPPPQLPEVPRYTASPPREKQQQQQQQETNHNKVSLAAMARIRHMLHSDDNINSNNDASRQSNSNKAEVEQDFQIVGGSTTSNKQGGNGKKNSHSTISSPSSSSWLQVEKNNNEQQPKQPQRQFDRTGDFRTPLTQAREALTKALSQFHGQQQQQQQAPSSSTLSYLQSKFDALHGVGMQLEVQENQMRLATASVLAEIASLKKLEQTARMEALTWVEMGSSNHGYNGEEDEQEENAIANDAAATAAQEFLYALQF